jgi:PAS domain S-box-containing protein
MDHPTSAPSRQPRAAHCATHLDPSVIEKAVHVAANAMFLTDRSGRIGWVNQAFTRLYGHAPCDVLGLMPDVLKSGSQSDMFYRNLWETLRAGRVWRGHICNRHRDGRLLDVDQTITPVCDDRGEVTHYLVVCDDITSHLEDAPVIRPREASHVDGSRSPGNPRPLSE